MASIGSATGILSTGFDRLSYRYLGNGFDRLNHRYLSNGFDKLSHRYVPAIEPFKRSLSLSK